MQAASAGVPGLVLTNHALLPDGRAAFEVLVPSNGIYTLEISTDLKKWAYGFTLEATDARIPVVSPEPIVSMPALFLRARVGRGLYTDFGLHFHASAGAFSGASTPSVSFPVPVDHYTAVFEVEGDGEYPDGTNVFFTGPAGAGLVNAPSDQFNVDTNEDYAWYQSPFVSSPAIPPAGTWTVRYKATNLTCTVPDAQVGSHLAIPVPTVVVAGGVLQQVSWVYRNPVTGAALAGAPVHALNIELQLDSSISPEQFNRLYESDELPPETIAHTLTAPVNWNDVSTLHLAYDDDLGNHYVISYQR
jgi:hypothetical protein